MTNADPDDGQTPEDKRHDQLTTAPKSTDADARPRIETTTSGSRIRIDIRDDANARPGAPD
ncbi:multidrug transporter [Leifsonia poae]|uniref:multidrug transporter n=1 Tax=Leifsonia poae TaxID=110933 RepID=UPI003D668F89